MSDRYFNGVVSSVSEPLSVWVPPAVGQIREGFAHHTMNNGFVKAFSPEISKRCPWRVEWPNGNKLGAGGWYSSTQLMRIWPVVLYRKPLPPLFLTRGESAGPYVPGLIDSWRAAGVGGKCSRCGTVLEDGWQGAQCTACEREYAEAHGCRCLGDNLCHECREAGATDATRGQVKCTPDCSTLCCVCSPDD